MKNIILVGILLCIAFLCACEASPGNIEEEATEIICIRDNPIHSELTYCPQKIIVTVDDNYIGKYEITDASEIEQFMIQLLDEVRLTKRTKGYTTDGGVEIEIIEQSGESFLVSLHYYKYNNAVYSEVDFQKELIQKGLDNGSFIDR